MLWTQSCAEDLSDDAAAYVEDFGRFWWGGRGARVALLTGGGTYERPRDGANPGGPIKACDPEAVAATSTALSDVGYTVVQLDMDELGSAGSSGERARPSSPFRVSASASCTLNAMSQSRVTLSLRQEHLRAGC